MYQADSRTGLLLPSAAVRDGVHAAPTTEKGYVVDGAGSGFWTVLDEEKVPELQWPNSIEIYDQMRRQDAQVISVLKAVQQPIRRTAWRVSPAGARDEVVEFVARNLGLPIEGADTEPPARLRDRFSWKEHLQLALTSLPFGHSVFEQQYRIGPDERGVLRAWIRKLAWRPPRTLSRIDVASDGGLVAIHQNIPGTKPMEVDRLVVYVNEREGGNWLGQSLLRPAYKYWVLKDRMLRVQAQTVDRNGMGVPVFTASELPTNIWEAEEYSKRQDEEIERGLAIAKSFRSGRAAGASIAHGADLKLLGVEGTLPDANKPIRYYDEQIGRAVLANFLNLGGDDSKGSYALGETLGDFFTLSLQSFGLSIADTASMHIVEDLVDHNFGTEEPAPRITFDEIGVQQRITATSLKELIEAGAITVDDRLERYVRQTWGLPTSGERREMTSQQAREIGELLQKVYLAVGPVITKAEARTITRAAGADLDKAGDTE